MAHKDLMQVIQEKHDSIQDIQEQYGFESPEYLEKLKQIEKIGSVMIKPFEVVAREYMYFKNSNSTNKHIAQIYQTIRYHGCAQREAVIQEIQEAIAKVRLDIEQYKDDIEYVHECKERITYCEDFLRRANEEIPVKNVELRERIFQS